MIELIKKISEGFTRVENLKSAKIKVMGYLRNPNTKIFS